MPRVSINICCYNSEPFIKRTLEQVLAQTFKDFEVIVIDDGSQDKTGEVVKSFQDDRIRYYYQDNRGLAASRNRAIALSAGEYIAFLDHDDSWMPEKIKAQVAVLENEPTIGLVYTDAVVVNSRLGLTKRYSDVVKASSGWVVGKLFMRDFVVLSTVMARKTVISRSGLFDERLKFAEDYDFLFRAGKIAMFQYIHAPLARYLIHANNYTRNKVLAHQEELIVLERLLKKDPAIIAELGARRVKSRLASVHRALGDAWLLKDEQDKAEVEYRSALSLDRPSLKTIIAYCLARLNRNLAKTVILARQKMLAKIWTEGPAGVKDAA